MNTRANIILVLLFCLMFVLWLSNKTIDLNTYFMGIDMYHIQLEAEELQKENILLRNEWLREASYTIIYSKAINMGFTNAQYVVIK
jgi:hypothetical protein